MNHTHQRPRAHVLGVDIDTLNMESTLAHITVMLREQCKGYICVAGVHGVMEARRSRQLAEAYSASALNLPDGTPLAWVGRLQGHSTMGCVTGPALMLEIFRRSEFAHVTHFLYGGIEGVAAELRDRLTRDFPWVRIVGAVTPPFRDLSSTEQDDFVATVAECKPDILWIGLGCPKQELFMSRYLPQLDTRLMFGVGAAFDFHTGRIRDCAPWIKRAGLHWLHRLLQNPRRLWRRNLHNNPAFLWHITLQLTGLRRYARTPIPQHEHQYRAEIGRSSSIRSCTERIR
jgi:N-acetylglucosaminyldiphosphoundecaprenol N-acetyl-beta-D-mannosaminyltransferase